MGEFRIPIAVVAVGYVIAVAGLVLGLSVVVTGRVLLPVPAKDRYAGGAILRLMGALIVFASALMALAVYALDLNRHHALEPTPIHFAIIAGTPIVLCCLAALQWLARRRGPSESGSAERGHTSKA